MVIFHYFLYVYQRVSFILGGYLGKSKKSRDVAEVRLASNLQFIWDIIGIQWGYTLYNIYNDINVGYFKAFTTKRRYGLTILGESGFPHV